MGKVLAVKPVVRVGVLGGTSAGKTFHFGRGGILENTISYCIGGKRESLGVAGKDNVVALVTNVSVSRDVPSSTLSINYMGFDMEIFGRRTIVRWLEYPGQDNVGLCVFMHNLLRAGNPGLLERVYEIGVRIHRVILGEESVDCASLKAILDELYNLEEEGGKLLDMETIAHVLFPNEIRELRETDLREILTESLTRCQSSSPKRLRGVAAENVLNGFVYLFVALLGEKLLSLLNKESEDYVKYSIFVETLAAYAVAAAYLGDRSLLAEASKRLQEKVGIGLKEYRMPAALNSMCIGPGCSPSSYPHNILKELQSSIREWERIYRQAVWNLLHHRLIVTGPLLSALLLALTLDSNVLAIMAPFLYERFIFIYTLKHLATSTNIEVIGGEKMRDIIRKVYSILPENWSNTEELEKLLKGKIDELEELRSEAEELRKEIMQYAGHGLSYVVENICSIEVEKRSPTLADKLKILKKFGRASIDDSVLERLARTLMENRVSGSAIRLLAEIIDTLNIILIGYWENINEEISIMHSYVIARLVHSASRLAAEKKEVPKKSLLLVSAFFDDYIRELADRINAEKLGEKEIESRIADFTACVLEETKKYLLLETPSLASYYKRLEECERKLEDIADLARLPLPEPVEVFRFRGIEISNLELEKLFKEEARVLVPGGSLPQSCSEEAPCNIPFTAAFLSLIYEEVGKQ